MNPFALGVRMGNNSSYSAGLCLGAAPCLGADHRGGQGGVIGAVETLGLDLPADGCLRCRQPLNQQRPLKFIAKEFPRVSEHGGRTISLRVVANKRRST